MIKKIIKRLFVKLLYSKNNNLQIVRYVHPILKSYSQYNEDIIVDSLLNNKEQGFYVDIGANDPVRNNNTKRFSLRGWYGLNVEPQTDMYQKIVEDRPEDINLNIGIGNDINEKDLFILIYNNSTTGLSTFNKKDAKNSLKKKNVKLKKTIKVKFETLNNIFNKYLKNHIIDFRSLDVEGYELNVLQSNDWTRFRPTILLIEINRNYKILVQYLKKNKYELVFNNGTNGIFMDIAKHKVVDIR